MSENLLPLVPLDTHVDEDDLQHAEKHNDERTMINRLIARVLHSTSAANRAEAAAARAESIADIDTTDDAMTAVAADPTSDFARKQSALITDRAITRGGGFRPAVPRTVVSAVQAGHGFATAGTVGAATDLNDATQGALGARSIKLVTNGAGATARVLKSGLTLNMTGRGLIVWIKADDLTTLNTLSIDVGTDSTFASYVRATLWLSTMGTDTSLLRQGEWTPLSVPWSALLEAVVGNPARAALTAVRLNASDTGTTATTVHLGGVETYQDYSAAYPNGVISITFDDSWDTQWTKVLPAMAARGMRGTLYPILSRLDQPGYLTTEQILTMHDRYGWEIGAHAPDEATHTDWRTLTAEQLDEALVRVQQWQQDHGVRSDVAAYPQGRFDQAVSARVARHFRSCSATGGRALSKQPTLPYRLGRYGLAGTTPLSAFTGVVDRVKAGQGWADFGGHALLDSGTPSGLQYSTTDFVALLDYIAAQGVAAAPVGEVLATAWTR